MSDQAALSQRDRQVSEWLFVLTFVTCAYFYAGGGWNQNSQFDLTRAIVERHTFAIDAYAFNTGDVSRHGGHVYSNKSPGLSWLGAVPYTILYAIESRSGMNPSDPGVLTLNNYFCTLVVVAPFLALVPAILYRFGRRRGVPPVWCAFVALTTALGTQLLPYSTYFILHVPSGALMLAALRSRRAALGGFLSAAATCMNYLCAPAIFLFALVRPRSAWRWFAGAAPPLILLAIYQRVCFGAFSTIGIAKEDSRFLTKGATMGVFGWPTRAALYGITVSPYRGLFYFAPVLIMAIVGFVVWARKASTERTWTELLAILGVSAVFFAFNLAFLNWEGGFGIGARYLVPLIPLWGVAMLYCDRWQKPLFVALAVLSFAINFTATAVDPQPSGTIPAPLTQYLVPLLLHGHFPASTPITPPWSAATFTGHTSVNRFTHDEPVVFFFHPPGSLASEWASFNLGEPFFGAGDARSLIPIALILAVGVAAILTKARQVARS